MKKWVFVLYQTIFLENESTGTNFILISEDLELVLRRLAIFANAGETNLNDEVTTEVFITNKGFPGLRMRSRGPLGLLEDYYHIEKVELTEKERP